MVILSVLLVIGTTVLCHFLCISNLCDYFTVVILSLSEVIVTILLLRIDSGFNVTQAKKKRWIIIRYHGYREILIHLDSVQTM